MWRGSLPAALIAAVLLLQGCTGATPARCASPVTVLVTVEEGVSSGVRDGVLSFVRNDPMLSGSEATVVVREVAEKIETDRQLAELDDASLEYADVHVHIARRFGSLRGKAFRPGEILTDRFRPLFVISDRGVRNLRKSLHGTVRLKRLAGWVARHEGGHLRGLKHHTSPFCIMAKPNASFGRLCETCRGQLARCVVPQ